MLVFAYLARDSHRRVEADAMLASIDLTRAIGTEIDRNLASVKLAMEATVRALETQHLEHRPEIAQRGIIRFEGPCARDLHLLRQGRAGYEPRDSYHWPNV